MPGRVGVFVFDREGVSAYVRREESTFNEPSLILHPAIGTIRHACTITFVFVPASVTDVEGALSFMIYPGPCHDSCALESQSRSRGRLRLGSGSLSGSQALHRIAITSSLTFIFCLEDNPAIAPLWGSSLGSGCVV